MHCPRVVAVLLTAMPLPAFAQARAAPSSNTVAVAGTWQLVSFESRDSAGVVAYPLGRRPQGILIYDAGGRVAVQLLDPDRPRFASQDRALGTDAEVRAAFNGSFSYYGRYVVDSMGGTITHHVEGASFPNWMGSDLIRLFHLEPDRKGGARLILATPLQGVGGQRVATTLVWRRLP